MHLLLPFFWIYTFLLRKQASEEELARMKENTVLCSALHTKELQNILVGILDEPSAEIRHMILSHQLEYNHDFAEFVQEMLDTLDGTAFEKQAREKEIQNIVDQMMD